MSRPLPHLVLRGLLPVAHARPQAPPLHVTMLDEEGIVAHTVVPLLGPGHVFFDHHGIQIHVHWPWKLVRALGIPRLWFWLPPETPLCPLTAPPQRARHLCVNVDGVGGGVLRGRAARSFVGA